MTLDEWLKTVEARCEKATEGHLLREADYWDYIAAIRADLPKAIKVIEELMESLSQWAHPGCRRDKGACEDNDCFDARAALSRANKIISGEGE